MDKPTLIEAHDGQKLRWIASYKGIMAAELTAEITDNNAILHNRVYLWSKSLCREYLGMFVRIREQLRRMGVLLVMVCSDHYTEKMGKYWKLMGFAIRYEVPGTGASRIPCAVMEV